MAEDPILHVDTLIHAPVRLAILSVLVTSKSASFKFLKEATNTTDGNLNTHLSKLEAANYIKIEKRFVGKKPLTECKLTATGRKAFMNYLTQMEQFIKNQDSSK